MQESNSSTRCLFQPDIPPTMASRALWASPIPLAPQGETISYGASFMPGTSRSSEADLNLWVRLEECPGLLRRTTPLMDKFAGQRAATG